MTTRIPNAAMNLEYQEIDSNAAKLLVTLENQKDWARRSCRADSVVCGGNSDHGGTDRVFGRWHFLGLNS